ncbi:MAG: Porphobilinogen deaminase [Syntrophorhabdaceae bacterium PtaU1.Bin034]|nr:MAG: Porphobilinogen deaminase [Syntrophorhabdaceae bacterium PtaU1.Bin034]
MKKKWIVGTRGSKLALRQTEIVINNLRQAHPDADFEIKIIKTTGDSVWNTPLYLIGQKGLFIKEIEEALAHGDVDLAVHSMKDLPTELLGGLTIAAVLKREDPRDTFISLKHDRLSDTPPGSRLGTSSMRRKAQLLAFRKDLEIVSLRGNVDTRLRKLEEQDLDGIILAHAGVRRMGFGHRVKEVLPVELMVPPGGQGAIGIETRSADEAVEMVRPLNDAPTEFEVATERKFQNAVGGGCSVPLGINASLSEDNVTLHAVFGTEDGTIIFKDRLTGPKHEADALIEKLLERLRRAQKQR